MRRSLKWAGGVSLALVALIILVAALFDWNWLREPIARRVADATGRSFAINGDLDVHLSLRPRIVANDVVLGNAPWAKDATMATLKRLDFRIDLLPLLTGKVNLPEIALTAPRVALELGPDGVPNWLFDMPGKDQAAKLPTIDKLTIDQGSATYRDAKADTDLSLAVQTREADADTPEASLEVTGKGRFKGMPTSFGARGGAVLSVRSVDRPYPIKASAMLGTTKARIDGQLLDPLHLRGQQLNFQLEGSDLALLYPIIGVPIPPTPAYKLAGYLDHAGDVWTFHRFTGTVGRSDLAGDFVVDRGQRPQFITARLVSKQLDLKDFGGFIGSAPGNRAGRQPGRAAGTRPDTRPASAPPPGGRVLPSGSFNLEKLRAANADVQFRGERILTATTSFEKVSGHLIVDNGTLKLAPLDFGVAGGNLVLQVEMDGRKPRIATHADITAKGLRLGRLFPTAKLARNNTGLIGGRARLQGSGNSIAQMLASANGAAALIMDGGSVSELMLRLSNLDIANTLGVLLGGDQQVPIHCMVADFKAVAGDFKVATLLLDTPKVNVTGSGNVDFRDESLHLRLVSESKGFSLASLRGPIAVGGSFAQPVVRPEANEALVRGGLAVALGAATAGIGALLPLLDFGNAKSSNCAALVSQTKADVGVKASDLKPQRPQPAAPPTGPAAAPGR